MAQALATERDSSLQKQLLYSRYAHGDLSLAEVTKEVSQIVPVRVVSWQRRTAMVAMSLLAALILPTWVQKKD